MLTILLSLLLSFLLSLFPLIDDRFHDAVASFLYLLYKNLPAELSGLKIAALLEVLHVLTVITPPSRYCYYYYYYYYYLL